MKPLNEFPAEAPRAARFVELADALLEVRQE